MVPNIISTKDLYYLEDIYEWNFNSTKLINSLGEKVVRDDVKKILNETYNLHKDICEEIINILGGKHE